MAISKKNATSTAFSVDEIKSEGPFRVCRCSIAKGRLKQEIRRIERRLRLHSQGFRPGRSPLVFTYRSHRRAIDTELIARLSKNPPAVLKQLLDSASLPPGYSVENWEGEGPLVISVRILQEPSISNPAARFNGMAGSNNSNPLEPQAGWDGSALGNLPQSQSQLLASHGLALGSSLADTRSELHGVDPAQRTSIPPAGTNPVAAPAVSVPGSPEHSANQQLGNPAPQAATPAAPQPESSPELAATPIRQALAESQAQSGGSGNEQAE